MSRPLPPGHKLELGQEAVDAARERQALRMARRKTVGLVCALFSLPVMFLLGFGTGWGIFPPEEPTILELAGRMMVTERCAPVFVIDSVDASRADKLQEQLAAWYLEQSNTPGTRNVESAQFPTLVEGKVVFVTYLETCDTTPEQPAQPVEVP